MNLFCSEEHESIRATVRRFAETKIKPLVLKLDEEEAFSEELTCEMGKLGLFGMTVPEPYGGKGMDMLSFVIAIEELARVDSSQAATVAAHETLGICPILKYGTEEQKNCYLPRLCTGNGLWAFGLTEPDAGSDSRGTKIKAVLIDDYWNINGSKTFITNGSTPLTLGVTVQTVVKGDNEERMFTCILVDQDTLGFSAKTMKGKLEKVQKLCLVLSM